MLFIDLLLALSGLQHFNDGPESAVQQSKLCHFFTVILGLTFGSLLIKEMTRSI